MFGFDKKRNNNGNHRDDLEARIRKENEKYENKSVAKEEKVDVKAIKEPVSNNGHHVEVEAEIEQKPIKTRNNGNGNGKNKVILDEEDDDEPRGKRYEVPEEEDKPDIPGKGFLYHAKKENRGEASRLNEREIVLLSVGDTKQSLLKKGRSPVYETWRDAMLMYKIALDGKGREEAIELKTIESEKNASNAGQAFGGL